MKLTYTEIAKGDVRLTSGEAVALALAAARGLDASGALPPPEHILLSSDGRVTLDSTDAEPASEAERVRQLAELLQLLLGLSGPGADATHRAPVPGGLMILLSRATGNLDAPAPSWEQFQRALVRFASADPTALASLYWRSLTPERQDLTTSTASTATVLAWRGPAEPLGIVPAPDRRRPRPRPAEFQRDFRRTKRRRFVHRATLGAGAVGCLTAGALGGWFVADTRSARPADARHSAPVVAPPQTRSASRSAIANEKSREVEEEALRPITIELKEQAAVPSAQTAVSPAPLVLAAVVGDNAFSPSFGRQGRSLLFHTGRARGALMRASIGDAGDIRVATVLRDGSANYHAALSPDGEWMAYDSDRDGIRGVYVARADASEPRRISGSGYAAVPSWSPEGRRLTFIKADERHPRVWNVWVADVASGALTQVSHHRVGQAWRATWFPDGDRVAYSVENKLVIANLRTGASRVFRSPRPGSLVRTPAVSPDGRSIVFQVHGDGAWLLDVPTGTMRRVLADRSAEEFAWSPDGTQVAYHTRRGRTWSVWHATVKRGREGF